MLSVDKVKEMLALNKKNQRVKNMEDEAVVIPEPVEIGYQNVVGQESITRFDENSQRNSKKRKKNRRPARPNQGGDNAK
jgi:hypothetical protein